MPVFAKSIEQEAVASAATLVEENKEVNVNSTSPINWTSILSTIAAAALPLLKSAAAVAGAYLVKNIGNCSACSACGSGKTSSNDTAEAGSGNANQNSGNTNQNSGFTEFPSGFSEKMSFNAASQATKSIGSAPLRTQTKFISKPSETGTTVQAATVQAAKAQTTKAQADENVVNGYVVAQPTASIHNASVRSSALAAVEESNKVSERVEKREKKRLSLTNVGRNSFMRRSRTASMPRAFSASNDNFKTKGNVNTTTGLTNNSAEAQKIGSSNNANLDTVVAFRDETQKLSTKMGNGNATATGAGAATGGETKIAQVQHADDSAEMNMSDVSLTVDRYLAAEQNSASGNKSGTSKGIPSKASVCDQCRCQCLHQQKGTPVTASTSTPTPATTLTNMAAGAATTDAATTTTTAPADAAANGAATNTTAPATIPDTTPATVSDTTTTAVPDTTTATVPDTTTATVPDTTTATDTSDGLSHLDASAAVTTGPAVGLAQDPAADISSSGKPTTGLAQQQTQQQTQQQHELIGTADKSESAGSMEINVAPRSQARLSIQAFTTPSV